MEIVNLYDLKPGNLIFVKGLSIISKMIAFGQSFQYKNSPYSQWDHVAMIINDKGDIIEAHANGVRLNNIYEYAKDPVHNLQTVDIGATDADRMQMVNFLKSCLGDTYGFLTIACIGLTILTGFKLRFRLNGTEICSGLVARALERGDFIFKDDPTTISPADLAKRLNVTHG